MSFVILDLNRGEQLHPLRDLPSAAEKEKLKLPLRRGGGKLAQQTLHRWALAGRAGVQLEVVRVGSTLCSSVGALRRFIAASTNPGEAATAPKTSAALEHDAAEAYLVGQGFGKIAP